MNKIITICLALTLIVGCKKIDVDFTYSPAEPKAGETISFSNNATAGESWAWTFGDNSTSLSKNPSKVYKKPGEYMVTLMVDSAKQHTCSKLITVYDTIPTFVASSDSILYFHDVTLKANIYNPFKYNLTYEWTLPDNCVVTAGDANSASLTLYFTTTGQTDVQLTITQNGKQYNISQPLTIYPAKAPAIVMHTSDNQTWRQRMINDRLEYPTTGNNTDLQLIEQTCDTMLTFNATTFTASNISSQIDGFQALHIQHLQIDAMQMKWYITTADGLFAASFDGSDLTLIDSHATGAIHVDTERNRIYWAATDGLYAMPLIKSKNNQFTTSPVQYNHLNKIDLITVNNDLQ